MVTVDNIVSVTEINVRISFAWIKYALLIPSLSVL